jgi:class 3 adenylate cyclase/uncharacterized protein YggT (Ycf19 family)
MDNSKDSNIFSGRVIILKGFALLLRFVSFLLRLFIIALIVTGLASYIEGANHYYVIKKILAFTSYPLELLRKNVPTFVKGFDIAPWLAIVIILFIKGFFDNLVWKVQEYIAKLNMVTRFIDVMEVKENVIEGGSKDDRVSLLKKFIEVKKKLEEAQKELTFLSIDVISSTNMKKEEEKVLVEYSFNEYKKFVDNILAKNRVWKVSWTPDGVMAAFWASVDAVSAAQSVLNGLNDHNKNSNEMKSRFEVRCGANFGKVMFDLSAQMEEVSDHVIDIAGHLQKYARPNTLWITKLTFDLLTEKEGFIAVEQQVDGYDVMEWKK